MSKAKEILSVLEAGSSLDSLVKLDSLLQKGKAWEEWDDFVMDLLGDKRTDFDQLDKKEIQGAIEKAKELAKKHKIKV